MADRPGAVGVRPRDPVEVRGVEAVLAGEEVDRLGADLRGVEVDDVLGEPGVLGPGVGIGAGEDDRGVVDVRPAGPHLHAGDQRRAWLAEG